MRGRSSPFRDTRGSTVAEFAMVLPIVIFFLLGIVDAGRLMWTLNRIEKGTQMGVRYAAVTDPIPSNLLLRDFALQDSAVGGNAVSQGVFGNVTCSSADQGAQASSISCNCSGSSCASGANPIGATYSVPVFNNILDRVRWFTKDSLAVNVEVKYENVGLGYAGDPNGADVAPLITVTVKNFSFSLPDVKASLTMEDGAGTVSN
jgi:Flp pilus assembly protein TadG